MIGMRGMGLRKRTGGYSINSLPSTLLSGLVSCFNTELTPGNGNFSVQPPSPFNSTYTIGTYAISFIANTNSVQDICCSSAGEFPRIFIDTDGRVVSYFIGSSPFFDKGIYSIPINSGSKNVYILVINDTTLQHQLNGNSTITSSFQTGTPRNINMNRAYRLGGYINNTNLFQGSYYFFGFWNRALTSSEIAILNTVLS